MCASSAEDDVREKKKNIKMNPRRGKKHRLTAQRCQEEENGSGERGGGRAERTLIRDGAHLDSIQYSCLQLCD